MTVVALVEFSDGGRTEPGSQEPVEGHWRAAPLDVSQHSDPHPKAQLIPPLLEIERVINIMVGNLAGVICDGAKLGCALKVGTGAGVAVKSAMLAMRGVQMPKGEGVVGGTAERTVHNLGLLANLGMVQTDAQILQIMLKVSSP